MRPERTNLRFSASNIGSSLRDIVLVLVADIVYCTINNIRTDFVRLTGKAVQDQTTMRANSAHIWCVRILYCWALKVLVFSGEPGQQKSTICSRATLIYCLCILITLFIVPCSRVQFISVTCTT